MNKSSDNVELYAFKKCAAVLLVRGIRKIMTFHMIFFFHSQIKIQKCDKILEISDNIRITHSEK